MPRVRSAPSPSCLGCRRAAGAQTRSPTTSAHLEHDCIPRFRRIDAPTCGRPSATAPSSCSAARVVRPASMSCSNTTVFLTPWTASRRSFVDAYLNASTWYEENPRRRDPTDHRHYLFSVRVLHPYSVPVDSVVPSASLGRPHQEASRRTSSGRSFGRRADLPARVLLPPYLTVAWLGNGSANHPYNDFFTCPSSPDDRGGPACYDRVAVHRPRGLFAPPICRLQVGRERPAVLLDPTSRATRRRTA